MNFLVFKYANLDLFASSTVMKKESEGSEDVSSKKNTHEIVPPKISIIVPIYNVELYLARCLESILKQKFSNFEVILIDDGSSDNCGAICDDYAAKDKRFKVVHQANFGVSHARNKGLAVAKGKYIGFVDPDDYIDASMYQKMYNELINTGSDMVVCDYYKLEGERAIPAHIFASDRVCYSRDFMEYVADDRVPSHFWSKLYKRQLFMNIRFPEGRIFEDLAIFHEIVHRCERIAYTHECLYYYSINVSGQVNTITTKNSYDYFEAWYNRYTFLKRFYPENSKYVAEKLIFCGTRAYWVSIYLGEDKDYAEYLRSRLLAEANIFFLSPWVSIKNKLRLLIIHSHFNLYKFYLPKAVRKGRSRIFRNNGELFRS